VWLSGCSFSSARTSLHRAQVFSAHKRPSEWRPVRWRILKSGMNLTITPRKIAPDVDVVELTGRIKLGKDNGQIETTVADLLSAGARKIVLDLSGVTYVDSSGVGTIALSASKAGARHASLAACGANGMVREIFRITRVDLLVPFFHDVDSAVASFSS